MGLPATAMETGVFEAELTSALAGQGARPHLKLVEKGARAAPGASLPAEAYRALALVNAAILGVFWLTFHNH